MLTIKLPKQLQTRQQAKDYLKLLSDNGYSYHPDDSADSIHWGEKKIEDWPTEDEGKKMNELMDRVFKLMTDPYGFLLVLDEGYLRMRMVNEFLNYKNENYRVVRVDESYVYCCYAIGGKDHEIAAMIDRAEVFDILKKQIGL